MTIDFQRLQNEVSDCRALLLQLQSQLDVQPVNKKPEEETLLHVKQAADFLGIAPQTVYQRVKDLPHKKRFGKLYFIKSELVAYLKAGTQNGLK